MFVSFALSATEEILNHYLQLDPETKGRLNELAGKVIVLESAGFKCYWLFTRDGIHLSDHYDGNVDVTLKGSSFNFLRLTVYNSNAEFFASDINITGDIEIAQQFKVLFSKLDIDWEEQLSRFTGDIFAHQVGNFVRTLCVWAKQSATTLHEDFAEYLQEEACLLPPREELQDFFTAVDSTRNGVERMKLRVERLQQCLAKKDAP